MQIFWLVPEAWLGLAALAVPVLIHLLTRPRTRRVPFPTLRFLRSTALVAFRRKAMHDWPLLLIRLLLLLAAVAALAAPVIVSGPRLDEWRRRFARAIVLAPGSSEVHAPEGATIADEHNTSFVSAVFRPTEHLADGLVEAVAWLERQPPARREIVIAGDLKEGTIDDSDFAMIPAAVGLRFLPAVRTADAESVAFPFARVSAATPPTVANATLLDQSTRVAYSANATGASSVEASSDRGGLALAVRAAPADLPFAIAARNAILARGVRVDRAAAHRVLVVFQGADVGDLELQQPAALSWIRVALSRLGGMTGGQQADLLVVLVPTRAADVSAVHVLDRIARAAFSEDLTVLESRRISAAALARWSRPPGVVDVAPPADEGDRRWLWGAALLLMLIETFVRRSGAPPTAEVPEEKRVA